VSELSKSQMRRIALQEGKPMPTFEEKEQCNKCANEFRTLNYFLGGQMKKIECNHKHCPECGVKLDGKK